MKYITILNLIAKLIFTIAIFVFVKNVSDYIYVPLLNSFGFIVAGIFALWIVFRDFGVKFKIKSFKRIKKDIKEGFPLFLSIMSIPLFNETNIFILGIFTDYSIVAEYTLSSRIIGILISTQVPIVNSIFPFFAKEFKSNLKNSLNKLNKIRNYEVLIYILILTLIGLLSNWIMPFIFGEAFYNSIYSLIIMIYVPVICFIGDIYGNQILLNLGKNNLFSIALILTGLINLSIIIPLVVYLKDIGAAFSRLISETFLTATFYIFAKNELKKIKAL